MEKNEKIEKLLQGLGDKKQAKEIQSRVITDPVLELRSTTANFIKQKFDRLQEESTFSDAVKKAILEKVESGEAGMGDLMQLLNQTKMRETEAVESILQFFKPTPEGSSILENKASKEDDYEVDHKTMQTLDILRRLLTKVEAEKAIDKKEEK